MARRTPTKGVHRRAPLETIAQPPNFGAWDLDVLGEVRPLAEDLVGEHLRVTSFGPHHRLYEVVTLGNSDAECRAPQALAQLFRFDREERVIDAVTRVSRFYRICLQDDNVLCRVQEGFDLRALLLYVLTHELIHIVRFESFEVIYGATGSAREDEERIVDQLTRSVLVPLRDQAVSEVIEGLSLGRVDVLAPAE